MPGVSIHVVDVARGIPAAGMAVAFYAVGKGAARLVAQGTTDGKGLLGAPELASTFARGPYRVVFEVAGYYRAAGIVLPPVPFLDAVTYDFGIDDPAQHYHLPFKCTPWGYSCFRGGA
jgi:5-hydroxyisourate hydrolase